MRKLLVLLVLLVLCGCDGGPRKIIFDTGEKGEPHPTIYCVDTVIEKTNITKVEYLVPYNSINNGGITECNTCHADNPVQSCIDYSGARYKIVFRGKKVLAERED